jgi:hypothetical protein
MMLSPDLFPPEYLAYTLNLIAVVLAYPGGHSLLRVLSTALERIGSNRPPGTAEKDAVMMEAVAFVLSSSSGKACSTPKGGDTCPEIALAVFTMGASFVRNAPRWSPPPTIDPFLQCLHGILQLAVSNIACSHRDVALRALAILSSIVALAIDRSTPLHHVLLSFGFQQGSCIMQGVIWGLVSFTSGAGLPKVCRLIVDLVHLAVTCAEAMDKQSVVISKSLSIEDATAAFATKLLYEWMVVAQGSLGSTGIAVPFAASDALMAGWNWDAMAQIVIKNRHGRGADLELLRLVQRALRRMQ